MQFQDQLTNIKECTDPKRTHEIKVRDRIIPVRFQHALRPTNKLIVTFHGAVDRTTRAVPAFIPFSKVLAAGAHQLAVSDPGMLVDGDFSLAWYAGDRGFAAQDILKTFFHAVCDTFNIERTIYFGTSGGGFAALYFSWHHPGSVVVAGNPQTKINEYYSGHITRYRTACWPDETDLADVICEDIRPLYAAKIPNFVIYVQSATDPFHMVKHMAPFLVDVGYRKDQPLVLNVDYFGKVGHSPTFNAYVPWLQAAMTVDEVTSTNIVRTKHGITSQMDNSIGAPKPETSKNVVDPAQIERSNMIRDWQLGDMQHGPKPL